jgi:hypothetical protein
MVTSQIYDHEARLRSFEITAEVVERADRAEEAERAERAEEADGAMRG